MAYKTTADRFYDLTDVIQPEPPARHKDICRWKVGDKVKFTNDYGDEFGPFTVLGYTTPENELGERYIYIDSDSPWFPTTHVSLSKWVPKPWLVRSTDGLSLVYADTEEKARKLHCENEEGFDDDDIQIDPLPVSDKPAEFVLWVD